jgi:hypothetical protein
MTRKQFEIFAEEIRLADATIEQRRAAAKMVIMACRRCNPGFKPDRFLKACGLAD